MEEKAKKRRIKEALEQLLLLEEMVQMIAEYQELLREVMGEMKKDTE